jgi:hypothetical protein
MCFVLVVLGGCQAARREAEDDGAARIRELEARVAWLEAQVKVSAFLEDEILDLELRRAAMLVTYTADHPAILDLERKIAALGKVRELEDRGRRDAARRRLEAEREVLLGTYTPDHPKVQGVDAQIAFLGTG